MVERDEDELEEEDLTPILEAIRPLQGSSVLEIISSFEDVNAGGTENRARDIYKLYSNGLVRLIDTNPPTGLGGYFFSLYSLWFWLITCFMAVLLAVVYFIPQIYPLIYLRYVTGAVFVLYIPGYALIEALYPKNDSLDRLERFVFRVGLSIAIIPLVGLILNYTSWGIRLDPVFISLLVVTLAFGIVGVYRQYGYFKLTRLVEQHK